MSTTLKVAEAVLNGIESHDAPPLLVRTIKPSAENGLLPPTITELSVMAKALLKMLTLSNLTMCHCAASISGKPINRIKTALSKVIFFIRVSLKVKLNLNSTNMPRLTQFDVMNFGRLLMNIDQFTA